MRLRDEKAVYLGESKSVRNVNREQQFKTFDCLDFRHVILMCAALSGTDAQPSITITVHRSLIN